MNQPRSWIISAGFLAALYLLGLSYNLNYFYLHGGAVNDAGVFAWLASNANAWPMPMPAAIGGNFLSIHASFIFFLTTPVLRLLGTLPEAVRFSLLMALWLPIFWLAMFLILRRPWLALLLTLNGLNLSMLGFPHIESFIASLGFLSLALLLTGRQSFWLALIPLLFALSIREDAGLHIGLLIVAMVACQMMARGVLDRRLLALGIVALTGSVLALLVQKLLIPAGAGQIANVYLGHPAFATVSLHGLLQRALYWATRRLYIFLPLAILAVTAIRYKLALGGIAIALPWLALSFIAAVPNAGNLYDYYCFPLLFAFFWPLFLAKTENVLGLFNSQIVMGAVSTIAFVVFGMLPFVGDGGLHDRAPWMHLMPPQPRLITATQGAVLDTDQSILGDGAAALAMNVLQPQGYAPYDAFSAAQIADAKTYIRFKTAPPAFMAKQEAVLAAAFPDCRPFTETELEVCGKNPAR